MLQNAHFLAKFRADTAENERTFAEILPKIGNYPTCPQEPLALSHRAARTRRPGSGLGCGPVGLLPRDRPSKGSFHYCFTSFFEAQTRCLHFSRRKQLCVVLDVADVLFRHMLRFKFQKLVFKKCANFWEVELLITEILRPGGIL